MFIELTDHLRCPEDHPEAYLVLIPDRLDQRSVRSGLLGCPVCQREWRIEGGVARFGAPEAVEQPGQAGADPGGEGLSALLGLSGPGGYVVLVGDVAPRAVALGEALGGVHLAVLNPGAELGETPGLSVLEAPMIPLKARSMRGAVLGSGYADAATWQAEAQRVVLPGRRIVGRGTPPACPGLTVLGTAGGWWVASTS